MEQRISFAAPPWLSLPIRVILYRPLAWLLPGLDKDRYVRCVVQTANAYFQARFLKVSYEDRLLFLPYCLRAEDCPTRIDPQYGMLCPSGCRRCRVGEVKAEAETLGYRVVYLVVSGKLYRNIGMLRSHTFILHQIRRHRPRAVIGALCAQELSRKYLSPRNLSPRGALSRQGARIVPQTVLLDTSNCRHSTVDWGTLIALIRAHT